MTDEIKEAQETEKTEVEKKEDEFISYEDFARLDIRIGTITEVEVVEDADKLLRLTVDLGEDESRQIISGIREFFDVIDFLVGKQCPFVANLEPRVIRGYESQGMIMAASADDIFSLLIPHQELPNGTKVR